MKGLTPYRPLFHTGLKPWLPENRLGRFFGPDFFPEFYDDTFAWTPGVDLVQLDDEWLLTAECPGMKMEDIEIDIVDDVLTVKGEKRRFEEKSDEHYTISERNYGMFERSFTLPRNTNAEKIKAEFENGVLSVHIPLAEAAKGRRIAIKAKK